MLAFLFLCVIAAASGRNESEFTSVSEQLRYVDFAFEKYDHAPKDGDILEAEWDSRIYSEDLDNDTCVTLTEYKTKHSCPVSDLIFKHYDHDHDGCLKVPDMSLEFHLIDHDRNNVVDRHEWEQYFIHLVYVIFPQGR